MSRPGAAVVGQPDARAVRVLLVDDHAFFRRGLRELLAEHGFEVVGEASNGATGVRLAQELKPDVVLMDLEMPVMDGQAATRALRDADADARVLVLTISESDADALKAITAGAAGYLLKDAEVAEIVAAVRAAAAGYSMISPQMARALVERLRQRELADAALSGLVLELTERETAVLRLVVEGRDNRAIALALNLAPSTVKHHVARLLTKLGVGNRVQAAVVGVRHGLV